MHRFVVSAFLLGSALALVHHRGGSCGRDAIPYKIKVDPNGRPRMFCDSPTCIGEGSRGNMRATCDGEFSETVCTRENEWTAGLIETTNRTHVTLRTLCCAFDRLQHGKELQTVLLYANDTFEGGAVHRSGRMVAFDLVKEVRKTVGDDGSVQYIASIFRMPCTDGQGYSERRIVYTPQRSYKSNNEILDKPVSLFPENGQIPKSDAVQFGQSNYVAEQPLPAPAPAVSSYQPSMQQSYLPSAQVAGPEYRAPEPAYAAPIAPQPLPAPMYAPSQVMTQEQTAFVAPSMASGPLYAAPAYPVAPAGYAAPAAASSYASSCSAAPTCTTGYAVCSSGCGCCAAGGGGGGAAHGLFCFSGDMTVFTPAGEKKIADLAVGDHVLSIDENLIQFSPVLMFLHKLDNVTAEFYRVQLENGNSIELTADHLIYKTECRAGEEVELVHAKELKVGQCLDRTTEAGIYVKREKIVSIEKVIGNGIYAPLTSTGDIFVNGIMASCHSNYGMKTLQQTFFGLYRSAQAVYEYVSPRVHVTETQYEIPFGVEYLATVMDVFVPKTLF